MSKINVFMDSQALISGLVNARDSGRALLQLAEDGKISLFVSEQVLAEVERNLAKLAPKALPYLREAIRTAGAHILHDPKKSSIQEYANSVRNVPDAPVLVSALKSGVDYLVISDQSNILSRGGLPHAGKMRIGTSLNVMKWVDEDIHQK